MTRTNRHYFGGPDREGKQDFLTRVARDDRGTGLRDHKHDRRVARASLKSAATVTSTAPMSCSR